ncbi:hypothetical protein CYMTET_15173 [Cymbomonas tetramitiformis]|uniref:Uncharacterized protein n=1 Tax=Cymbomonas tetramitiformis TaxID=36881 RepID=A0AAE0L9K9_9CHLO|nr:hypothetical protein CYMTET_15173 [Cymbomonas tetramitiformis]
MLIDTECDLPFGALRRNEKKTLTLRKNMVNRRCAFLLAAMLSVNSSLTMLDLSGNRMQPQGARAVARALQQGPGSLLSGTLSTLVMDGISLVGRARVKEEEQLGGVEALAEALKESMSLTALSLRKNVLGPKSAIALATGLAQNTSLTTLSVAGNAIGAVVTAHDDVEEGCSMLAAALSEHPYLTHLDLSNNFIGQRGAGAMAKHIALNHSLDTFVISPGVVLPVGALRNRQLATLNIHGAGAGLVDAIVLGAMVQLHESLSCLDLGDSNVKLDEIRHVFPQGLQLYASEGR